MKTKWCEGQAKSEVNRTVYENAERDGYNLFADCRDEETAEKFFRTMSLCEDFGDGSCPWWPNCKDYNEGSEDSEVFAADGSRAY